MESISFYAGKKALSAIQKEGLNTSSIKLIAGAAGGPKWLVLSGLDRAIFPHLFANRKEPLFAVGSSIGAWRFAAICRDRPGDVIERFQEAYINQRYTKKPSPAEVTRETLKIYEAYVSDAGVKEIITHPFMRLNIISTKCAGPSSSDHVIPLSFGMAAAAVVNSINRRWLKMFFSRALFHDDRDIPPFHGMNSFRTQTVALNSANLQPALLSSGSIPLVMSGVKNIPGTEPGTYRDGGMIDYQLDIPFFCGGNPKGGIVFYPHYQGRVVPGWFDKPLKWRKPSPENMEDVFLVCPSGKFVEKLPYGKIPDRDDFAAFMGRDRDRIDYWERSAKESERIGEEFLEAFHKGLIPGLVRPMPE
jgi:hypothetical protein